MYHELWFDVEKRYNTTSTAKRSMRLMLWFDVEKRYNTTTCSQFLYGDGCGLM